MGINYYQTSLKRQVRVQETVIILCIIVKLRCIPYTRMQNNPVILFPLPMFRNACLRWPLTTRLVFKGVFFVVVVVVVVTIRV